MWMHAGQPRRKRGIGLLCICTSYVCLRWSASRRCWLKESSSAQSGHCTHWSTRIRVQRHHRRQQRREADWFRHGWGCAYVGQSFIIAASGNHPLLDGVAAFVPWLISSFPHPHPLGGPLLSASHSISTLWSCMHAAVVAFLRMPL